MSDLLAVIDWIFGPAGWKKYWEWKVATLLMYLVVVVSICTTVLQCLNIAYMLQSRSQRHQLELQQQQELLSEQAEHFAYTAVRDLNDVQAVICAAPETLRAAHGFLPVLGDSPLVCAKDFPYSSLQGQQLQLSMFYCP